jgi:ABC-2 type transport system permease protein
MKEHPSYFRVFLTFARNSLIRDMTFRTNFVLQCVSSASWTVMNVGFYLIVFHHARYLGAGSGASSASGETPGWDRYEFFIFLATTWFINSLVQAFFMPNAQEFSELIRTGHLDFALLKPIDTQFLVSFRRVEWSSLVNMGTGLILLAISLWELTGRAENPLVLSPLTLLLYPAYILMGVAILYSLMISLAATSIWLGRNQTLYNFWFYITNFSRYPMEIYQRGWGVLLWFFFTFLVPVLVVANVPARLLARPFRPHDPWQWPLAAFALFATAFSLLVSRWVFNRALRGYRSASS